MRYHPHLLLSQDKYVFVLKHRNEQVCRYSQTTNCQNTLYSFAHSARGKNVLIESQLKPWTTPLFSWYPPRLGFARIILFFSTHALDRF